MIKILSLYRLSLGQPRQQELLEYVLQTDLDEQQLQELFINLAPILKNTSRGMAPRLIVLTKGQMCQSSDGLVKLIMGQHPFLL